MIPIVMFVGNAGSGKDTAAQCLKDFLSGDGRTKVESIALADPIKEAAMAIFGFSQEQLWGPSERRSESYSIDRDKALMNLYAYTSKLYADFPELPNDLLFQWFDSVVEGGPETKTARHILQSFGTELGRKVNRNIWIDYALRKSEKSLGNGTDLMLIRDGRFRNEVLAVRKAGGFVVNIRDPRQSSVGSHSSESEQLTIPNWWYDVIVFNNKVNGTKALTRALRVALGEFLNPKCVSSLRTTTELNDV